MNNYLYQMEPVFDEADITSVAACVRSSWVIEAERTAVFEQTIAQYVGAKYAIAVPSCTVALAVSLMALGIGPGDEVIVPDLTFVASANAVNMVGATPVLADIHPKTIGLDVTAATQALTPRTRAIMPVWFNGRSPHIQQLAQLAQQHNLFVVEDAACALGSRWGTQHAGTFGDLGCFSFNTTKIITTGTGGMIVTSNPELHERVERLKNHGRIDRRDHHPMIGYNFHFSDLLAALGLSQMQKLPARVAWKKQLCHWYYGRLASLPGIDSPPLHEDELLWYPDIFVDDPLALKIFLESKSIQTRLYFPPIHTQPCYATSGNFLYTEQISPRGLWLPAASFLTERQVAYICTAINMWVESRESCN